jgi:hypothetical protein
VLQFTPNFTGDFMEYTEFISKKLAHLPPTGMDKECRVKELFPHQRALVNWSLRRGRSANFSGTGLGKMRMEIAYADAVAHYQKTDVIGLCPLAVAAQIVEEAAKIGLTINHVHDDSEVRPGINITNYDRLHKFDLDRFGGMFGDESGIIKHHDSKTFDLMCQGFARTPFKLLATATPSPNDFTELGTHAEFLGIRSRSEMLAEFFVHDGGETQKWRLKGHARADFWKWVSSWAAMVRNPADLGFDGSMYQLPPLHTYQHTILTQADEGSLFAVEAQTLMERKQARKKSLFVRAAECAKIVNESPEIWLIWCELNSEADELKRLIPDAVEVRGSDKEEIKEKRLLDFAHGKTRVLISKSKIAGWGLNFQICNHMAFVGVTDSFESYYQSVRRSWRFGQHKPVHVHVFSADTEGAVLTNLQRKEKESDVMAAELTAIVSESVRNEVLGVNKESNIYAPDKKIIIPNFLKV